MKTGFVKMQGCGNDFAVFDTRWGGAALTPGDAIAVADRHMGVGCDQVIVIEPSDRADAFMRIFNGDGSEAGACGNATRCVVRLLFAENHQSEMAIETISGILPALVLPDGQVQVDMGAPRLDWRDIPLAGPADTLHLDLADGDLRDPAAASMGNPHATFFVDSFRRLDVAGIGARLETNPIFPERANIGFAHVTGPGWMQLRVWERGAGLTLACGSGACAAAVNAARRGLTGRQVSVSVDGGTLNIDWREDGHVLMTGPAVTSFQGTIELSS